MVQQNTMVVVEQAIAHVQPAFEKIAQPMGNLVRYQEEAGYALQIMRRSPYMQRCIPQTIEDAVINVAAIGLSLNPVLQHGFLIPRRQGNHVICCFDPGYRGFPWSRQPRCTRRRSGSVISRSPAAPTRWCSTTQTR